MFFPVILFYNAVTILCKGIGACHIYEIRRVSEPPGGAAVKGCDSEREREPTRIFPGYSLCDFPGCRGTELADNGYENYPEALEPHGGNLGREAFFWVPGSGWRRLSGSRIIRGTGASCRDLREKKPLHQVISYGLHVCGRIHRFLENPISIQHPMADIEIVAWDSALTLLISRMRPLPRRSGMRIHEVKT